MEKSKVANRIKQLRMERNMTQNALANAAGISPTYIYQLERGEKSPTVEYLDHICWGLGITLQDFFTVEGDEFSRVTANLTGEQKELLTRFLKSL